MQHKLKQITQIENKNLNFTAQEDSFKNRKQKI